LENLSKITPSRKFGDLKGGSRGRFSNLQTPIGEKENGGKITGVCPEGKKPISKKDFRGFLKETPLRQ